MASRILAALIAVTSLAFVSGDSDVHDDVHVVWKLQMDSQEATAVVGQTVKFTWAGFHNVMKVDKAQYDACTKEGTELAGTDVNEFALELTEDLVGVHYFICSVGGHCSAGQKLMLEVTATAPAATPDAEAALPAAPAAPSGSASGAYGSEAGKERLTVLPLMMTGFALAVARSL